MPNTDSKEIVAATLAAAIYAKTKIKHPNPELDGKVTSISHDNMDLEIRKVVDIYSATLKVLKESI
ncbi:hypothetical protein [Methylomagnum ishizawai]|uniref:hypothetical protein n=1 Tax=Methylomagnum ishizawai TaxID=1760988 RepID=UPI001C33E04A|nr:hypothetical protein [Methylomagnum ishizawai]BBL75466.1 hypothetical protein MishRS11D_25640 [Methylomagnum ishizawai]